jgi:receptor protein-tyrosine kinase
MTPATHSVTPLPPPAMPRAIGAMLVDSGRLTIDQADQILRAQRQRGIRFGEAAIMLGLLTEDDIQHALSDQFGYPWLRPGQSPMSQELVSAYQPKSKQVEALRALRSQLMLRWFTGENDGSRTLAIVSPGRGEGRSYLAANLAVLFSQLGESTLLIDADMRHGRQHQIFHVENTAGLSTVLAGRSPSAPVLRLDDLQNLSVLTAGPVPPNPQELLGRDVLPKLMEKLRKMFEVIIIDTPAASDYADAQTLAARAGGALLVARPHHTGYAATSAVARSLGDLGIAVVGSVLNHF